jgi:NTE family protein
MTLDLPRPEDKFSILKRIPLFSECTEEQLHLVTERSRLVEYKKGERIYHEGANADAFYVVASGRLQVFTMIDGQRHLLAVLHNGDTLGEISLLTGEVHSATVEALNDTLVLQLEKQDFDELINRIPSLVLYLSRLLSKRLRTRQQVGGTAEAMMVAIYSAAKGVGRTLYAITLAAALRHETNREVLLIDLSTAEGESTSLLSTPQPDHPTDPDRRPWTEGALDSEIVEHPLGFHVLNAGELIAGDHGELLVVPLVSELAKRYRYILVDLPVELGPIVLKTLTQADLIYLVTDSHNENVIRTSALIRQVREGVSLRDDQLKIVLNLIEGDGDRMTPAEIAESLAHPINYALPHQDMPPGGLAPEDLLRMLKGRESTYAVRVRRIARELGGVLVGLALGSGAALGLAHIGILKVIEREGIPIDIIAGSSIGAMIGGLWASGKSAEDLEAMALRFRNPWQVHQLFILDFSLPVFTVLLGIAAGCLVGWGTGLFAGLLFGFMTCVILGLLMGPLIGGPIQGTQLTAKLETDFEGKTFEDCWVPMKVVAANPMAREQIVFDSGSMAEAVRASVSIPGIFKPTTRMGKVCIDGGVVNPIPVSVLKDAGASRIIAVNVFPTTPELTMHQQEMARRRVEWDAQLAARSLPLRLMARLRQEVERCFSPLVFDVIMRSMQSMEHQIAEVSCRDADLIMRPTLASSHWLEFMHPEKFIRRGEEEALRHLPKLRQLVGMPDPAALTTTRTPSTMKLS